MARGTTRPAAQPAAQTATRLPAGLRPALGLGLGVLALVTLPFGVLEVHYATDTWIALAAGRQIATAPAFPLADTFSYSVAGRPWINQNWLSHLALWRLYDWGAAFPVLATWLTGLTIFTLVGAATWLRCRSLTAALVSVALAAFGMRDHLKIRPATVQLLLVACLALAVAALLTQGARRRWWPLVLLLLVFGVWPHAHGSFLFGYGVLVLLLAAAGPARWLRGARPVGGLQIGLLSGVGLFTAAAGVWLSPFGLENFTHPFKVVESDTFREVGEWLSPLRPGKLPPVGRFWAVLAVALAAPLLTWVRGALRGPGERRTVPPAAAQRNLHRLLVDAALVALSLGLALFARRFVPLFLILGLPPLLAWAAGGAARWAPAWRAGGRLLLGACCWPAAVGLGYVTVSRAQADLLAPYPPGVTASLLDRVTKNRATPHAALAFLRENAWPAQPLRLLTDWKLGGAVMFAAPNVQVFIDGRAQQVYDEAHVQHYLMLIRGDDPRAINAAVARAAPDVILLTGWSTLRRLNAALEQNPEWIAVLLTPEGRLLVRRDGPLHAEIVARERAGRLQWPNIPEADLSRGNLWATALQDPGRAADYWQSAVRREPRLGGDCYRAIVEALQVSGRAGEAAAYVAQERQRIAAAAGLSESERTRLLALLTSLMP